MDRKDKIKALVENIVEKQYGDVISFYDIGTVIQDRKGTVSFNDVVQAAKKELLSSGYMLESVRCIGYRIVQPNDYTRQGVKMVRAGARRIDKGIKIMQYAPTEKMSVEAREAHNRVYDNMMNLQAAMAGASVQIHMLEKKRQHPLLGMK